MEHTKKYFRKRPNRVEKLEKNALEWAFFSGQRPKKKNLERLDNIGLKGIWCPVILYYIYRIYIYNIYRKNVYRCIRIHTYTLYIYI